MFDISPEFDSPAPDAGPGPWRFCVAPMMDWSDRHFRFFLRQISRQARLYTEMVTTAALLNGNVERHLRFDEAEHPIALQLGGSEPDELARCSELGERWGYDEINLNCGCPSDRVQEGRFGACLMREPGRVAASVRAMRAATRLPVTVKHRLGVDDSEGYVFLRAFVETVAEAGCEVFMVHARKAWLNGLSPKENREIPPLDYEMVYRLKQDFPQLTVIINGGIKNLGECQVHLRQVDGVMLGREAYENPWRLAEVDSLFFGQTPPSRTRLDAMLKFLPYIERHCAAGLPLGQITRHILGLYRGQDGGRGFRRVLSELSPMRGAGVDEVREALAEVEADAWADAA